VIDLKNMDKKKVYIVYAPEDNTDFLEFKKQAAKENQSYEMVFQDEKISNSEDWRKESSEAIQSCQCALALISKNMKRSDAAFWEVKCCKEKSLPMLGVFIGEAKIRDKPAQLTGVNSMQLAWDRIEFFVEQF